MQINPEIYIRVDASAQIGLGHVMRCTALACMVKDEFSVHFFCLEIPASEEGVIRNHGFSLLIMKDEEEFFSQLTAGSIVVLDHYGLGSDYQERIKLTGASLVCIDDTHENNFFADLIVNHAPGILKENYQALETTQFALGPEYALLRPAILQLAQKEKKERGWETALICFGGADPRNLTYQTLEVLWAAASFKRIVVVTGSAYPYLNELSKWLKTHSNVEHYHSVSEAKMAELFGLADLAIVPSSGVLLEAIASGVRIISGYYVDNQKFLFENYKELNAFVSAEDFSPQNLSIALSTVRQKENTEFEKVIDGHSGERILKLFRQLRIEKDFYLRKAVDTDVAATYEWASDKSVRMFSFNKSEITFENHRAWFLRKINDDACYYYLAVWQNNLVGSIRFDIQDGAAVISYLLASGYHSQGLGIVLLKKGIERVLQEKNRSFSTIFGIVMAQNIPSVKAFDRLNFRKEKVEDTLRYTLAIN